MKCAVIGASGYSGGELLRLLELHPIFQPTFISAHSNTGEKIVALHPHLTHFENQTFSAFDASSIQSCDLIFTALPHGESANIVAQFSAEKLIVDLGADFRLVDPTSWLRYYTGEHAGSWTYGLPELPGAREKISTSTRIANPGCYATAITLSAMPALNYIDTEDIVVVAASGTSGAGRSSKSSLGGSEVMNSLTSYKFGGIHQHTPEIEESLRGIVGKDVKVSFTPILAPMPRGILATTTAKLTQELTEKQIRALFVDAYADEEFVKILPIGHMPQTRSVLGSNYVHMQIAVDAHTNRLVVSTAIDNLGKGAAGQAIQNANILVGLEETSGLVANGLGI